ncbi:TadE/TadG family type IV pilus assembly protein [Streptomyces tanashiensis]|uniref:Pilus assembly protein n=1 Tax=Streptomyces tanashiensis TaxID=67367 RepID=A0ABY6QXD9_9ACTN|nr:TadE/TadG family type IV pilus assembly protein [Streptomyces tanashiensis]UZX21967.1 pilus assembly protein [Streptomyces tanashiensis]GGY04212.1 septum formation initiator [Streptomyces tanashiensis]
MRAAHRDDDRGQVAVEFLGMVPLILLTLALLWQVVLVGYTYTLAGNAADEAARAAAVGDDCEGAAKRHLDGAWLAGARVSCPTGDGMVTAVVSLQVPALIPGVGGLFRVDGTAGAVSEVPAP